MIVMTLQLLNKLIRLFFDIGKKGSESSPFYVYTRPFVLIHRSAEPDKRCEQLPCWLSQ